MADGDLTTLANVKAWLGQGQVTEAAVIPAAPGPYTVTAARAAAWNGDAGVILAVSGALLTPVAADPADGEYAAAAGVYTFNAAQAGLGVSLAYTTVMPADALLARLITAVSGFIERYLDRQIASQAYAETRNGHGGTILVFANRPVTAVTGVTVDGVAIPAAADFSSPGYRFTISALILNGYCFTRGAGNVELAYTAGWAETPPDLEQACLELIAVRFKERDHIGQESASMQGQNVTFSTRDLPASVKAALQGYKKVAPV